MTRDLDRLFAEQGGVATYSQILAVVGRAAAMRLLRSGTLVRVWPNIYSRGEPDTVTKLHGLDLRCGEQVTVCLGTAAAHYGFDTQRVTALHILNPAGHQIRSCSGLVVHRRDGAPITIRRGRPVTTAEWTAVEVARGLQRPRALATLDAALRSGTCRSDGLLDAAARQAGRRGIATVRELIPLARPHAESPMESEARLVMIDGGLPEPLLQHGIIDLDGRCWRVDFVWPQWNLVVEYDGFDWHKTPDDLRRDRQKRAALEEMDWRVLSIVGDDVRRRPAAMLRRIRAYRDRAAA